MANQNASSPFLNEVANAIRVKHYSIRTEEAYVGWIKRFILFHGKRHPHEMGEAEVVAFLTDLAVNGRVAPSTAPSTQNQALNALVFLYRYVLKNPLPDEMGGITYAKKKIRVPLVLSVNEVAALLAQLNGQAWLVACLQYGSGLRLMESVRLRVHDLEFGHRAIYVRNGKGGKDRVVTLAEELVVRRCKDTLKTGLPCSNRTVQQAARRSTFPTPLNVNTRTHRANGVGSMYFPAEA